MILVVILVIWTISAIWNIKMIHRMSFWEWPTLWNPGIRDDIPLYIIGILSGPISTFLLWTNGGPYWPPIPKEAYSIRDKETFDKRAIAIETMNRRLKK